MRTLTAQLINTYKLNNISINHPIMPWVIRHAAYLFNRYAIRNDGKTSYFRRWNKERKTPLCEFGETLQYMVSHHKRMPKLESRFYKETWLGKVTMTSESIIGISGKMLQPAMLIPANPTATKQQVTTVGATLNFIGWLVFVVVAVVVVVVAGGGGCCCWMLVDVGWL